MKNNQNSVNETYKKLTIISLLALMPLGAFAGTEHNHSEMKSSSKLTQNSENYAERHRTQRTGHHSERYAHKWRKDKSHGHKHQEHNGHRHCKYERAFCQGIPEVAEADLPTDTDLTGYTGEDFGFFENKVFDDEPEVLYASDSFDDTVNDTSRLKKPLGLRLKKTMAVLLFYGRLKKGRITATAWRTSSYHRMSVLKSSLKSYLKCVALKKIPTLLVTQITDQIANFYSHLVAVLVQVSYQLSAR